MEVLVFKTSVQSMDSVRELQPRLDELAGRGKWNFALDDCDRILRVKAGRYLLEETVALLNHHGFGCDELED